MSARRRAATPRLPLQQVRVKNFKALRETGTLTFGPLTVFIGNNGSGKSSILEALETVQRLALEDLDRAFLPFLGYEHVRYKGPPPKTQRPKGEQHVDPRHVSVDFRGHAGTEPYSVSLSITERENNELFFRHERVVRGESTWEREEQGGIQWLKQGKRLQSPSELSLPQESLLRRSLADFITQWQFVRLSPEAMGRAVPMRRSGREVRLSPDGSDVAQYLLSMRQESPDAFEGLLAAVREVLPYAADMQPHLTSELGRSVYLQLVEQQFKVPGWMLSTGTLRVLALLALFRHPRAPPLVFIEELENGLDPRTLGLIVSEIRSAVLSGNQQVFVTTHSPYLLDLFDLSHVVLVERIEGTPTFHRPADDRELSEWAREFGYGPGTLYTRGQLSRRGQE